MAFTSHVLITNPHRPSDAFAAACQAAGSSPAKSDFYDYGGVCMLMAREQGAGTRVAVHHATAGPGGRTTILLPEENENPRPPCYSLINLTSTAIADDDEMREYHARLIGKLAPLLTALGMRWCWRSADDDGPWLSSIPAARIPPAAPPPRSALARITRAMNLPGGRRRENRR